MLSHYFMLTEVLAKPSVLQEPPRFQKMQRICNPFSYFRAWTRELPYTPPPPGLFAGFSRRLLLRHRKGINGFRRGVATVGVEGYFIAFDINNCERRYLRLKTFCV